MSRAFKFICHCCARSQSNKPGYTICQHCERDARNIGKLEDLIAQARPTQRLTPAPLLLARLWLAYTLKHHQGDGTVIEDAQALVNLLQKREQLQLFEKPAKPTEPIPEGLF